MNSNQSSTNLPRRAFLRLLTLLGGSAAMALFLQACQRLGITPPTENPTLAPEPATPLPIPVAISTPAPATEAASPAEPAQTTASAPASPNSLVGKVALIVGNKRQNIVPLLIDMLGINPVRGKEVLLKPNFNSADPTPGSTHPETLRALLLKLQELGAAKITIADRSGMGNTRQVMEKLGVFTLAQELGAEAQALDELPAEGWAHIDLPAGHWKQGFYIPKLAQEPTVVVQTCCLKTHRYGGHFTLSLKNSVGLVAKTVPGSGYNYMNELHGTPDQRLMIAEINTAYTPALVVLDGVEAFTDGGPDQGTRVQSYAMLAGVDRVALDAVGVAILRKFGSTPQVMNGPIFGLEQIARAVELGLGVTSPEGIEFITNEGDSARYADELTEILNS